MAFGAVLLGISDDYPILVYFALCSKERDPKAIVREVAHPVMFGGLTTIVTFAVMLLSTLPGQRQLAVFSMIGVAVSLIFSLIVLPHLLADLAGRETLYRRPVPPDLKPAAPGSTRLLADNHGPLPVADRPAEFQR